MLKKALSLHKKGQLAEAEALYREILAQNSKNADALHLLGVVEAQRKNYLAAIELFDRAIELSPNSAAFVHNRDKALKELKGLDEAVASHDRVLAIKPDFAHALNNRSNASMQSFSQLGQDIFVYNTFFRERRSKGYFVDIGAYDGVTFSNSLFFERHLGWQGICIEPLPSAFSVLESSRRAICLNCAVSDRTGVGEFDDVDMPNFGKMYSGLRNEYDPRHAKIVQQGASSQRAIQVPLRRLPDILDEINVRTIDYLSIDIEGGELKVLKTLDLISCDIRVMSVENNYKDPELRNYLARFGYRLVKVFAGFDDLYAKDF